MLKDDIIMELENNRSIPLSGQYLADKYQVSRNAVWKTINSLISRGYDIKSKRNSGYYLDEGCDIISEQGIRCYLPDTAKDLKIRVYDVTDSTNNEAKRLMIDDDIDQMLLIANEQTGGRGRLGRSFFSPADTGIYMSLIIRIPGGIKSPMLITMAAAVAVVRTIEKFTDIRPGIKWVNDIFVEDRKVCGILTEAVTDLESGVAERAVVGIGINVKNGDFPDELKSIASSVYFENITRNQIIAEIVKNLLMLYKTPLSSDFMSEYIEHNIVVGKRVKYERYISDDPLKPSYIDKEGTIRGIANDGALIVESDDGEEDKIFTGMIELCKKE